MPTLSANEQNLYDGVVMDPRHMQTPKVRGPLGDLVGKIMHESFPGTSTKQVIAKLIEGAGADTDLPRSAGAIDQTSTSPEDPRITNIKTRERERQAKEL